MKRLFTAFVVLSAFIASAQTNVIYGTVGDYGLNPQRRVNVTLTLISPNPRTVGSFLIRQDPIAAVGGFKLPRVCTPEELMGVSIYE